MYVKKIANVETKQIAIGMKNANEVVDKSKKSNILIKFKVVLSYSTTIRQLFIHQTLISHLAE